KLPEHGRPTDVGDLPADRGTRQGGHVGRGAAADRAGGGGMAARLRRPRSAAEEGVGVKVLIAEDDNTSRLLLETTLHKLGYEVESTRNGSEAWEAFRAGDIHLVISDGMMPEVDGPALCRRIRSEEGRRSTYIILLTALSGKGRYAEGIEAGADDFITKPFDRDELQTRLRVAERVLGLQADLERCQSERRPAGD